MYRRPVRPAFVSPLSPPSSRPTETLWDIPVFNRRHSAASPVNPDEEDRLRQILAANSTDWTTRLELAEVILAAGGGSQIAALLDEAPNPPPTENDLHRVLDVAHRAGTGLAGLSHVVALYLRRHPASAWANLIHAQLLAFAGHEEEAVRFYITAKSLNPSLHDDHLDRLRHGGGGASAETSPPISGESPVPPADSHLPALAEIHEIAREELKSTETEEAFQALESGYRINLVTTEGDAVKAHDRESDKRERLSALSVAIVVHFLGLIGFAFWKVAAARPTPPQIVASAPNEADDVDREKPEIKKFERQPLQMASAKMNVASVDAFSDMAMPSFDTPNLAFDPVGNGDSFGPSMSFGMGSNGGSVSFFGSRAVAKRVVFVVDFSASMGGQKDILMRKELSKSLKSLPAGIDYALIFFAGPAYAGQKPSEAGKEGDWYGSAVQDGGNRFIWYEGWDERERHKGDRRSAFYHYSGGQDKLPTGRYTRASPSSIQQSIHQIERTELVFGTDWRWPLMMAMNMKPDTIYFMTDGAFGTGPGVSRKQMIESLLEYNRKHSNARINTICMMILQAREELELLADSTRGEFTLVLEDGEVLRGGALDKR